MSIVRRAAALLGLASLALALGALAVTPFVHAQPARSGSAQRPAATSPTAPKPSTSPAQKAPSEDDAIDQVAATINDEAILASEVEEQLYIAIQRSGGRPSPEQIGEMRRQILDQMIDEKLIIAEAKRQGIAVSDAEIAKQVDESIDDVKERLGSEAAFAEQLQRENTNEARLRDRYRGELRRQLMGQRLVQKQIPRKPVAAKDAEVFFVANKSKFPKLPGQVRLAVIQLPPAPDSLALLAGRKKAEEIRARVLKGERFAKVAAEVSDDKSSAQSGGDLGFFGRGRMEPSLETAAFSIKNGEVSPPVRTAYGWHLVQPIERDTVKSVAGRDSVGPDGKPWVEVHARHILVRVAPTEADIEKTRAQVDRIREQAAKGTPWSTLVRRYSRFEGPSGEDGDLGFLSLSSLQPHIREGVDSLEVGEVSEVLSNPAGFNLFKLTDRRPEREYTLEEIREELPEAVAQIQFRERMDIWVKSLRDKARIEYKL